MSIVRVTPTQVAQAMKDDGFFSAYDAEVLIMRGRVLTIESSESESLVRLKTNSTYATWCSITKASLAAIDGSVMTVICLGDNATRQKGGVLLGQCIAS